MNVLQEGRSRRQAGYAINLLGLFGDLLAVGAVLLLVTLLLAVAAAAAVYVVYVLWTWL